MKKFIYSFLIISIITLAAGAYFYSVIYNSQVKENTNIYIRSTDTLEDVLLKLETVCNDTKSLKKVASLKKYQHPKPGMYILKEGMNNNEIINLLRSGQQTPVKVTFNNQNYIENLAGRLSQQIEADSVSILKSLTDKNFLKKHNLTSKTALHICMPYTYECYWNISPNELRSKFLKAYQRFWSSNRIAKAKKLHLNKNQVISLAAIVHKETQHKPERKKVAGVYLNRLRVGMPLQADPTVIFALKEKHGRNTVIKRVLKKDLTIKSAYNTYVHKGTPPSAIAMPDVDAIDAVLNASKHKYYYFCANPKQFGTHLFAKNLREHNKNAQQYQTWLNKQKVHR